jgi:hypothetical protein
MNLQAIQKLAPLASLLQKPSGLLSDSDLGTVAGVLAGDGNSTPLLDLFKILRDGNPDTKVADLLGSPGAVKVLEGLKEKKMEADNSILCTCPSCGVSFETELN